MKTSNTTLNLAKDIEAIEQRLPNHEYTLCKGLKQPFNNTNSGSRKIMQGIQMEQIAQLLEPEVPIVSTGYENQFGELSSNFIRAEHNYKVIAKISKFSNDPNRRYWLILYNKTLNELTCIERIEYKHITEFYGYIYNNDYLDSLTPGKTIHKGDVMKKTISYDEYNNRAEGVNLSTMYVACEYVKEDPIVISESASKRFVTPLIDKVEVKINDNDILLNLYGRDKEYKTFPDIDEDVKNNILCAVRRELKDEEALFTQSWERLKTTMMNDKEYIVEGKVIDIDVYCNNPEKLENSLYNNQIKRYYDETIRFSKEFVAAVNPLIYDQTTGERKDINISYDLQKMLYNCDAVVHGKQYISEKVFNNITMVVYIQQNKPLHSGDKITDRYGGKGVISKVMPDSMMPHYLRNGKWVPVDVLYSMNTCINRLNDGQLFETSVTYIGWQLLEYIGAQMDANAMSYDQAFALIHRYIELLNTEQAYFLAEQFQFSYDKNDADWEDNEYKRNLFIQQMLHEGKILLSLKPISTGMSIDLLTTIYNTFPFINKHCNVCAPVKDSNGKYRMVLTRRKLVIGFKYISRLKQLAEEKFSVVSLASTNIRNENSKSRMSKVHNAKFASTPVRIFGEMESSTITAHLGVEKFYQEFMLNSSSPKARRSHKKLLTGNPFDFDIELDEDAESQSAQILHAYLKELGGRFRFIKLFKHIRHPMLRNVVDILPRKAKFVVDVLDEDTRTKYKSAEDYRKKVLNKQKPESRETKEVIRIIPGLYEENVRNREYDEKLRRLGLKD